MTPDQPRVYLDTNVFIAAYEQPGSRSDHAWWLLDAAETQQIKAVTSKLTLAELLVKPVEQGADELGTTYRTLLAGGDGLEVGAVDDPVLTTAARLRALSKSTRLPDAIHVATAIERQCTHFVTSDARLSVPPGMTKVNLGPFALDAILEDRP